MSELRQRTGAVGAGVHEDGELARLEALKRQAIEAEDFDEAGNIKNEIKRVKAAKGLDTAPSSQKTDYALSDKGMSGMNTLQTSAYSQITPSKRDSYDLMRALIMTEGGKINERNKKKKLGITAPIKEKKDWLAEDPYNLQLIYDLGKAYYADENFEFAANVLMRGWKRMDEIADPSARLDFLVLLSKVSLKCNNDRQALAVLDTIEPPGPEDRAALRTYSVLACQVHGSNGNMQKCLDAFNIAIHGETSFDIAYDIYFDTIIGLRKAGAWDIARASVATTVQNEDSRVKLEGLEKFAEWMVRTQTNPEAPASKWPGIAIGMGVFVALIIIIYFLHLLETKSLSRFAGKGR